MKAKDGPLPKGRTGIEFQTRVKPRTIGKPGLGAEVWWDRGSPGVEEVEGRDAVLIPVTITKRVD